MRSRFDADVAHPADLTKEESRAYEEAVLRTITEVIRPGRWGPWIIESIELSGERPDTAVVFIYQEIAAPGQRWAAATRIWDDLAEEGPDGALILDSAPSHGAHLGSSFAAGELEAHPLQEPS